jgi:hypothetical protein
VIEREARRSRKRRRAHGCSPALNGTGLSSVVKTKRGEARDVCTCIAVRQCVRAAIGCVHAGEDFHSFWRSAGFFVVGHQKRGKALRQPHQFAFPYGRGRVGTVAVRT